MPQRLKRYFNSIANTLESQAEGAGVYSGRADIGKCREIISHNFIKKHMPPRFEVNFGGEIFGLPDYCSGQIDIIINHDMSASFKEHSLIRCPVESVVAALSIKSTLDKKQLFDALNNLASIPQLNSDVLKTGAFTKPFNSYISSWPSLYVFAFDGIALETCLKHINDFYTKNSVPNNRRPRAIIVNKKYIIAQMNYEDQAPPEINYQPEYQWSILNSENQGSPLFWMIIEISKGLSWLDGIYLNFAHYYNTAYGCS